MEFLVADQFKGENFAIYNGDCVEVTRGLPTDSVGLSVWSPPFESLYVFSDDPRDMSNCSDSTTFWKHFQFLIDELYRVTKPGRLCCIHCMQLPTSKQRDGFIGVRDFRGEVIRAFQGNDAAGLHEAMRSLEVRAHHAAVDGDDARAGRLITLRNGLADELREHPGKGKWIFHSEVMIRKDPVAAMQRSKSIGLLHKQLVKDSSLSRMALADYVVVMRKDGDNPEPISGPFDAYYGSEAEPDGALQSHSNFRGTSWDRPGDPWYSVAVWQRYAESVWMDIAQGDVLSRSAAREQNDERHIAPLQLTVIRRCIDLWSNPGDVVYSPFAGIGSELYVALQMGRKALGAELKASYFRQAVANCKSAHLTQTGDLFSIAPDEIPHDPAADADLPDLPVTDFVS